MSETFAQTLQALENRRGRGGAWAGWLSLLLLISWGVWACAARIPVLLLSESAEVQGLGRRILAQGSGPLTRAPLVLGQEVKVGDLLFEIQSRQEVLEEARQKAGQDAQRQELLRLEERISEQRKALDGLIAATTAAEGAIAARLDAAQRRCEQAEEESLRMETLGRSGLVPDTEIKGARTRAAVARADVAALSKELEGARLEGGARVADARAGLQSSLQAVEALSGSLHQGTVEAQRLEHRRQRLRLAAPIQGRILDLAPLSPGSMVEEGEWLATLAPDDGHRLVAFFPSAQAAGRLAPGQPARISSPSFPSMVHGQSIAHVRRVAGESHEGRLRAELEILDEPPAFPLSPGLPLVVEVETDRLSPLHLLLRAAGTRFAPGTERDTAARR